MYCNHTFLPIGGAINHKLLEPFVGVWSKAGLMVFEIFCLNIQLVMRESDHVEHCAKIFTFLVVQKLFPSNVHCHGQVHPSSCFLIIFEIISNRICISDGTSHIIFSNDSRNYCKKSELLYFWIHVHSFRILIASSNCSRLWLLCTLITSLIHLPENCYFYVLTNNNRILIPIPQKPTRNEWYLNLYSLNYEFKR